MTQRFSANLGFLWNDIPLADAIRAAAKAGFDAVECHFPYDQPVDDVNAALAETGLEMLGLNTFRAAEAPGDMGFAALTGQEVRAREVIDQAIDYAHQISTPNVHVMAGNASGQAARATYLENLRYATAKAAEHGLTILIEPLNHYDAPDYFLKTSTQAVDIIKDVGATNLKLMFDCYHLQIMEGDISRRLKDLQSITGHVQIASVPARSEPDGGELDYRHIMQVLDDIGHTQPIGAEYVPSGAVEAGLSWMKTLRK